MPQQPTFQPPFELADPRKRIEDLKTKSLVIGGRVDALREALMKKFSLEYSNPDDAADHVISELLGFSVEVQFGVYASLDSELKSCVGFEEVEIQETIQNLVYEINDTSLDRMNVSKEREELLEKFKKNLTPKTGGELTPTDEAFVMSAQTQISEKLSLKSEELSKLEIDRGHLSARIAVFYLHGIGVERNYECAETLFVNAVKQGYPPEELIKQGSDECQLIVAQKEARLGGSSYRGDDKRNLEKDVTHAIFHSAKALFYGGVSNNVIKILTEEPQVDETTWRLEQSTPLTCDEILEVFEGMSKHPDTKAKLTGCDEKFAARLVETSKEKLSLEDVEKISKKLSEISGDEKGESVSMKKIGEIMKEKKREKDGIKSSDQVVDWACKTPSTSCRVSYVARLIELGKNLVQAVGSAVESFVDRVSGRSKLGHDDRGR